MKLLKLIGFILIFFFIFKPEITHANINISQEPNPIYSNTPEVRFTFTSDQNDFDPNQTYTFDAFVPNPEIGISNFNSYAKPASSSTLEFKVSPPWYFNGFKPGTWSYHLNIGIDILTSTSDTSHRISSGSFTVFQSDQTPAIAMDHSKFKQNTTQNVYILSAQPDMTYRIWFDGDINPLFTGKFSQNQITSSSYDQKTATAKINVGNASSHPRTICMTYSSIIAGGTNLTLSCDYRLSGITIMLTNPQDPGGFIKSNETGAPTLVSPTIEINEKFVIPPPPCDINGQKCDTAVGSISTNPSDFVKSIFGILLSLAGGIAIILIMISGYRLMFSQGNPEKVQAAREQLTSAIVGLLFIIFSITILQVVGVDILKIPGISR